MSKRTVAEVKKLVAEVRKLVAGGAQLKDALEQVKLNPSTWHRHTAAKKAKPAGRRRYGKEVLIMVPLDDGTTRSFTLKQARAAYDYLSMFRSAFKDA